ncbi:(d)CMP kinase [Alysiella filiformis]|uniref:Cytidylate kinase n=1 Tax=Alysiella filiformis DSM 16848 TaxID=1120981 RepID=A0A286EGU9_9NEIS|nr:(d)CMP kinase [Alysiella filiformis]QMT32170.1 (d)CMP kinase [Alysiella filiformis]UBQ56910.1 (d)CMP kinase [Alysiella filiformis DSM 16848]SOD70118.1 cytidylate kinase [Alysiella filiformis DSM 16848]
MQKVIAIDGPSASGKGTIAARVAHALGWDYLDSGALYRLTALHAQNQQVAWQDEQAVADLAAHLPVAFSGSQILLAGNDVSQSIRSEQIGMGASAIAALPLVRQALLQRQRDFLGERGLVADGRDMGSVVFPQAALKIFLTATPQIRAERRAKQLNIATQSPEFERILADIMARDENDRRRSVAPLRQLPDARLLDTTHLTIEQAVQQVLDWFQSLCSSD